MNFQVTVLKILVSYQDGFAVMADFKRDMAILATSGRDWADRTRRLAAKAPGLDIWSQGLVEGLSGGWKLTDKGRAVLALMEARQRRRRLSRCPRSKIPLRRPRRPFLRCGSPQTARS